MKSLAVCGSITEAAAAVRIDRSLHYDWLKADAAYAAQFAEARARGDDALEDEATTRALRGVYEPNVFQGRFCYPQEQIELKPAVLYKRGARTGEVRKPAVMGWRDVPGSSPIGTWKKSDALAMFLLRGKFSQYRAQAVEVTGKDGGPIEISLADVIRDRRAKRAAAG